jgi:hypothetical protein
VYKDASVFIGQPICIFSIFRNSRSWHAQGGHETPDFVMGISNAIVIQRRKTIFNRPNLVNDKNTLFSVDWFFQNNFRNFIKFPTSFKDRISSNYSTITARRGMIYSNRYLRHPITRLIVHTQTARYIQQYCRKIFKIYKIKIYDKVDTVCWTVYTGSSELREAFAESEKKTHAHKQKVVSYTHVSTSSDALAWHNISPNSKIGRKY